MSGGGGPACLRLRLSLPAEHVEHFAPGFRLSDQLFDRLQQLIENDYPERLTWEELGNEYNLHCYRQVYKQFLSVAARDSEQ
jgi:succinylarginine dihydrolase